MCAEEHETREGLLCGEITHRDEHIGALRDEVQMLLGRVDELDHQNREMDAYQRGELEVSITTLRLPFFLSAFHGSGPSLTSIFCSHLLHEYRRRGSGGSTCRPR